MTVIDNKLIDSVTEKAKQSPRLRMNHNLHLSLEDKAHRLFNAMEPGTMVPVHRHKDSAETMILIRGSIRVLIYNDDASLRESFVLTRDSDRFGIHLEKGEWHTVEVLESGTVFFEVKDGPYKAPGPDEVMKLEGKELCKIL